MEKGPQNGRLIKELSADKSGQAQVLFHVFNSTIITTITHLNLKSTPRYFTGF